MIIQITKWGLANVVFRHRRILLAIALGSVCVGAIYCAMSPRIFRSDAAVLVRFADTAPGTTQVVLPFRLHRPSASR